MKQAKKFSIMLVALLCIYETLVWFSSTAMSYSLKDHLSTKLLPILEHEIAKYAPRYADGRKVDSLERYKMLQDTLLCLLEKASWSDVRRYPRDTNSFHQRSSICSYTRFPDGVQELSLRRSLRIDTMCALCSGKTILFVGPEITFHLHENLLHAFELYENRSHSCLGTEFCTFHQICRVPRSPDSSEPFFSPGGYKKYPSKGELVASQSGILRYILSNSLYTSSDMQDPRYTDPLAQVDHSTSVRQKERYWLGQARKADILILNRGPLPAPAWTYDGTPLGNWSSEADREQGEMVLDAALRVTLDRFLPETTETLRVLSAKIPSKKRSVLWHGSWYVEPTCMENVTTRKSVFDSSLDPWTLFYNAQVYMQNYILKSLLPHYEVLFVPMSTLEPAQHRNDVKLGFSTKSISGRKDCLRYQFGSNLEERMRGALLQGTLFALEGLTLANS